jgi:hypothetical protein
MGTVHWAVPFYINAGKGTCPQILLLLTIELR